MPQISRRQAALRAHLPWHGAHLTFLALFLVVLFRVETVNRDNLSSVVANQAKPESSDKRLTRVLRGFTVDFDDIARFGGELESNPSALDVEPRPDKWVVWLGSRQYPQARDCPHRGGLSAVLDDAGSEGQPPQ